MYVNEPKRGLTERAVEVVNVLADLACVTVVSLTFAASMLFILSTALGIIR